MPFYESCLPVCFRRVSERQPLSLRRHGGQDERRQVHRHRGRHHEESPAISAHGRSARTCHLAQETSGNHLRRFYIGEAKKE
jgi:hypothetical protein